MTQTYLTSAWSGDLTDRTTREVNSIMADMSLAQYEHTLRALGIPYEKPVVTESQTAEEFWDLL